MIPTVVVADIAHAPRDVLLTGFKPSNPELPGVIDDFPDEPMDLTCGPFGSGYSSQVAPSSSRPPAFGVRPPHCLKKNGTRAALH